MANTKEALMQAVITSVAKNNFENASIKSIANEVDTSVSTVYLYFKNKEDLFEQTCNSVIAHFFGYYSSGFDILGDEPQGLRELWNKCLEFMLKHSGEVLFLVRYRHSSYYTEEVRRRIMQYELTFFQPTVELAERFHLRKENDSMGQVLRIFVEFTLLYAEQVITGKANRKADDLAFAATAGAMKALEDAIVNLW